MPCTDCDKLRNQLRVLRESQIQNNMDRERRRTRHVGRLGNWTMDRGDCNTAISHPGPHLTTSNKRIKR